MSDGAIELPVEGLSDGVVTLRLPADGDVPDLVEACQDPAIQRYTTVPEPYGSAEALSFIGGSAAVRMEGAGVQLVTVDAAGGRLLGTVGLRRDRGDDGRWAIGYLLAPWARGHGIATRAVRLVSRFAFERLGAERIEIHAEPSNEASVRVAERAGFTREGVLRSYERVKGVRRDMVMFSLLAGELRS